MNHTIRLTGMSGGFPMPVDCGGGGDGQFIPPEITIGGKEPRWEVRAIAVCNNSPYPDVLPKLRKPYILKDVQDGDIVFYDIRPRIAFGNAWFPWDFEYNSA